MDSAPDYAQLARLAAAVTKADAALARAVAARDAATRDALAAGASATALTRVLGVNRSRVYQIRDARQH